MESSDVDLRRLQLDEKKAEQEYQIRLKELDFKREELRRSRWSSPLVLGIIAAAIAAAGNAYVSWLSAENQLTVESTKYSAQKEIERSKYEADRILEATKGSDPKSAAARIKFLIEIGLISDPNRQAALDAYIKSGDQSTPPPQNKNTITEQYQSGWLGGGNNQTDQCALGRAVVAQKYPGKTILLKSSSEQSKKDVFGRVEYKYFCTFEVG